ncbi:gamma-butyrobetaine hydroxylase-like domain-containing protein [Pseudohoeflea coraliihabitans]|uniref:DUF971 domain-containing protein n=1 Tax=Pseudohoeflea coraliihabitans TaxID=2860393 RepID=A0ABS6WPX3_9HYPH|nr:DUF971 domain-containing protein [Pseudohoeflea sp. DP4N28-3]MBW3098014.1 DUF971 domain-containing protein [Pseudohoeflea sp. DP4N28-3]
MRHEDAWPTELKVTNTGTNLAVAFDDGRRYELPAELLRVRSPSAEVQGHGPGQRVTVPGKRNVAISDVVPVGHYAVRLVFDDGHDSGIFTWAFLSEIGETQDDVWQGYLTELTEKGLRREP